MHVDHPLHVDHRGRTADAPFEGHIRDLIEQVLFTAPSERVNRPTFGSGLLQLVFQPNGEALAAATNLTVQANLQQWLGELIQVQDVQVETLDSALEVTVVYLIRSTQQVRVERFSGGV